MARAEVVMVGLLLLGLRFENLSANPVQDCPDTANSYFIADVSNRCVYYWCVGGSWVRPHAFRCAPGSGTPPGYRGFGNPCTEHVTNCFAPPAPPAPPGPPGPRPPRPPYPPRPTPPTTTTTTTTPTTTPSVAAFFSDLCVAGGIYQANLLTPEVCRDACSLEPQCAGADFDRNISACWFHGVDTVCGFLVPQVGCDHFRFTTCAGGAPIAFPATHALGGTLQPGVVDPTVCIALCQQDGSCIAVDFDATSNSCWFHDFTTCSNAQPKLGCIHLRLQDCPAP